LSFGVFRFGVLSSWWLRGLSTGVQTLDTYRILLDLPQTGDDDEHNADDDHNDEEDDHDDDK